MDSKLYQAIAGGDISVLEQSELGALSQKTCAGSSTLHVTVQFKRKDLAKLILDRCPSLLRTANQHGDTALHLAAKLGQDDIIELLIEREKVAHDKDVEASMSLLGTINKDKESALHMAVRYHHYEAVKLITEADAGLEYSANDAGETPLYLAAEERQTEIVKQILKTCPSCADSGPCGMNALHAAIMSNSSDITKLLLDGKPNSIRERNEKGWTPLHCAAYLGFTNRMAELLEFDSSVAYITTEDEGYTALHVAAREGNMNAIEVITQYCPDCWELCSKMGQNLLHVAFSHAKLSYIVPQILELGMPVENILNEPDSDGNTPLHLVAKTTLFMAAKTSDLKAIDKLLNDPKVKKRAINKENKTAWDYAPWDALYLWKAARVSRCHRGQVIEGKSRRSMVDIITDRSLKAQIKDLKDETNAQLVVATLIATVSFTAGITLPGGYKSEGEDEGMANLTRIASFKAFVISNTVALLLSTFAVVMIIRLRLLQDRGLVYLYVDIVYKAIALAMVAMVVAFTTGSYAVLRNSTGLVVAVCVIGSIFHFLLLSVFRYWLKRIGLAMRKLLRIFPFPILAEMDRFAIISL